MRVMVLIRATGDDGGTLPPAALIQALDRFDTALWNAGVRIAGEVLLPPAQGRCVSPHGPRPPAASNPVLGFWLWEVADMAEAATWARRCPLTGPLELELRPVLDAANLPRTTLAGAA
jgi:hypothetical protein